jgi:hypothetical protein
MKVSILKELKIFDAGTKPNVEKIIAGLVINQSSFTIDFSRCIIDYPATSLIIDKILISLVELPEPRILIIQTHLDIIELLLLHWFFIGSDFFKIDSSQRKNQLEDFKKVLTSKLIEHKVSMYIQVLSKEEILINEYKYGRD